MKIGFKARICKGYTKVIGPDRVKSSHYLKTVNVSEGEMYALLGSIDVNKNMEIENFSIRDFNKTEKNDMCGFDFLTQESVDVKNGDEV